MSETTLVTDDGVTGFLTLPAGDGPCPTIVFYPDAGGPRPAMSAMTQRLADNGFAVLQPHIFWRSEPYARFDVATVFSDGPERARLGAMMGSVRVPSVVDDVTALLARLPARARTDRLGCTGYCMGGRLAFAVATHLSQFVAVAGFHAGNLVSDAAESPHRRVASLHGDVLLGIAEDDPSCTPEHEATLAAALTEAGKVFRFEHFHARHGWCVPDFPVYDEGEAERHWAMLLAFFERLTA